ncbi:hypothetical protein GGI07_002275 [Coemansia sp. Benny D115]|nr:hypothetical protein GGI07_002275 [Coemansia sp. Benny D115]
MSSSAKGVLRSVKNFTKGYSPIQTKVREATSNDLSNPSMMLMSEIAQATYNPTEFVEVMDILDKRLNDKGKLWRHVFKALIVLDFCLHEGSTSVVKYTKDNIYIIKTLREFQHIGESGMDLGINVRQKAKEVTSLLLDTSKLEDARKNRGWMNQRMGFSGMSGMGGIPGVPSNGFYGNSGYAGSSGRLPSRSYGGRQDNRGHGRTNSYSNNGNRYNDEDGEMRRAIAESRRSAASSKRVPKNYDEEAELKKAIEESAREAKEDELKKKKDDEAVAAAVAAKSKASATEVDLLGGFEDSFNVGGGVTTSMSSVNNLNTMGGLNNMAMMSNNSFTQQQQQQFGTVSSATTDLMGAFGGNQMGMGGSQFGTMGNASASNVAFDPFGLGNTPSGMGMADGSMNMGGMGMTSTNPYDNSAFGSSSTNQFISQTTMTTTLGVSGAQDPFGQASAGDSMFGMNAGGMGMQQTPGTATDLLGGFQTNSNAGAGGVFDGASGAFGSAFDGGNNAKTLPFGINPNDPNAKLAEIARNSDRIDPFASLAMGSSSAGGSNNPFGNVGTTSGSGGGGGVSAAGSSQLMGTTSSFAGMAGTPAFTGVSTMMGTPGLSTNNTGLMGVNTPNLLTTTTGGSSLVDLSPAALATSGSASTFQSFGQVNRNPFATTGGGSNTLGGMSAAGGKGMSMNQLMAGGSGMSSGMNTSTIGMSQITTSMGTTSGAFGQQQPMNAFGGMQTPSMQTQQNQQMMFQQQQQQVNPFNQGSVSTNNQNNFFGL